MKCKVDLTEDSYQDLVNLSSELQKECLEMLDKLENNFHIGKALGNKDGRDLTGYYKIYFDNAKYRIVYKKVEEKIQIEEISTSTNIAEVWGIGERNNLKVYQMVSERVNSNSTSTE